MYIQEKDALADELVEYSIIRRRYTSNNILLLCSVITSSSAYYNFKFGQADDSPGFANNYVARLKSQLLELEEDIKDAKNITNLYVTHNHMLDAKKTDQADFNQQIAVPVPDIFEKEKYYTNNWIQLREERSILEGKLWDAEKELRDVEEKLRQSFENAKTAYLTANHSRKFPTCKGYVSPRLKNIHTNNWA
ncbi:hypothetical protein IWW36_004757 [Coemansia brasiliensis]|uniref:Uncharacterized protein n=1 Tax=Coemansia brasiliensis TaxID=2650707 RepID=A0A9W8LVZ5_9FUNG|nr:hypothetical protein IWW36_004757 [Coemansia brasiliensis]